MAGIFNREGEMRYWRKPLDLERIRIPYGEIHIIKERCKGCGFCWEYCPRGALEESREFNAKGYHPPRVKSEEDCVGCGFCEMICPEFAIFVVEAEKEAMLP